MKFKAAFIHYCRADDSALAENYLREDSFKYPVGKITDDNFFDTNYSEIGYINDFIENPVQDNKKFTIEQLTPREYFEECAKLFNSSIDKQIRQIENDEKILNHLYKVHKAGEQFPLTYINYTNKGQEGRHRMYLLGELYGWDKKYPVGIIRYIDEEKAKQDLEDKRKREIVHYVGTDIEQLKTWSYDSFTEFEDEVAFLIDRWKDRYDFDAELIWDGNAPSQYIIKVEDVGFFIDRDSIKIKEHDASWDDLDIEDLENEI